VAEQSQYAKIVELVRAAQATKAPLQRLADRYAVWFTPITILACGIAVALTHDWMRALAILVVATPCPLILATPVALIGGINRAARRFVIIRNGATLERLAAVDTIVFDKTGTLTLGKPRLSGVYVAPGFDRAAVLAAAAAIEERSSHLLARVLVDAVKAEGITLPASSEYLEAAGQGMSGTVSGTRVAVGARAFVVPQTVDGLQVSDALEHPDATLRAYVSIGDRLAAVLEYADAIRPDLGDVLARLPAAGIDRVVLLSGDQERIALEVASRVGIREAHGDLLPADKSRFIEQLQAEGHVVMMVGDGINDAPALSKADVGIALASYGAGIAAEAADVVILVDSLSRVLDALAIGRRSMRITRQSIWTGLGLSAVAMVFAGFGALPPVLGAALQEGIDVAVILNALRTARGPLFAERRPAAARTGAARLGTGSGGPRVATTRA
jgi:heavy metal translocating P-type ATPase